MRLSGICGKCRSNDWVKNVTGVTQLDGVAYEELSMRCCRCFHEVHFTHEAGKPLDGWKLHQRQPDELLW